MTRLRAAWDRWVAFWDEREDPLPVAWARILLGICWSYDFLYIGWHGLVIPVFGTAEAGGVSDVLMRPEIPLFYQVFPGTAATAYGLHAVLTLSSLAVMVGFFTRTSATVLLLAWAVFVATNQLADRGIDTLSRVALMVLAVSPAGRAWSVDARLTTGSFYGDGQPRPAFARRLLVFQLVLMYFVAGVSKIGVTWWPRGHFAALYYALLNPAVAAWDFSWLRTPFWFFVTQLGAVGTVVYQVTYPMVLVLLYWQRYGAPRWAEWAVRWRLEWLWIAVGGVFHGLLALTMVLGIFPWAMLALYPVWFTADELRALFKRR